jgi:hypothetical protein
MRRFLTGFVVAAVSAIVPGLALAGNQEVAEQIARNLRSSGQMSDYKIGVKYQDGTVWLRGQVTSQEQMKAALTVVFQTSGVARVVNELSVTPADSNEPAAAQAMPSRSQLAAKGTGADNSSTSSGSNPLRSQQAAAARRLDPGMVARADRVPNSFAMSAAAPVSAEEVQDAPQPIPAGRAMPGTMMQPDMRGPMAPNGAPLPMYTAAARAGVAPARYDQPCLPNYAWPSYAAYPNYANVTYPKQYSPTAWPYIGPFYPYPQVPLGWRKVTLEWDSGWWFLDFKDQPASCWHR